MSDQKKARDLVLKFFEGDEEKTNLWFRLDNANLGGMSPNQMIEVGRIKKLLKFIKNAAEGY